MQRWRKILFSVLALSFLILAPFIILYAQGIRFDFERKRFCKTGAIYLKVIPKKAKIFLNGKKIKETDPILGSAKIENLLPRKYFLEVKKEGFFSWKKELEVKEEKVTTAEIILFPQNIVFKEYEKEKGEREEEIFCDKIGRKCKIEGNVLYLWNEEKENFEKIFENLKGFDQREEKIAIFSNHEIWILKKEGKEFLLRESETIKDLVFLNKNYLAYLCGKKLKIAETDLRDNLNIWEIGEIEGKKLFVKKHRFIVCSDKKCFISSPLY